MRDAQHLSNGVEKLEQSRNLCGLSNVSASHAPEPTVVDWLRTMSQQVSQVRLNRWQNRHVYRQGPQVPESDSLKHFDGSSSDVVAYTERTELRLLRLLFQPTSITSIGPPSGPAICVGDHDRRGEQCWLNCSGPTRRSSQQFDLRGLVATSNGAVEMTTNANWESCEGDRDADMKRLQSWSLLRPCPE